MPFLKTVINDSLDNKQQLILYITKSSSATFIVIADALYHLSFSAIDEDTQKYEALYNNKNFVDTVVAFIRESPYWWHAREWARIFSGYYTLPTDVSFYLHIDFCKYFPYISHTDATRLAITQDPEKADKDKHLLLKIGRYLSKYEKVPERIIPDIVNAFNTRQTNFTLEVARTKNEIVWVYQNGPNSCMGKPRDYPGFKSEEPPVAAYATPDIKVLYVRDIHNAQRVIARTVVSNINNTYARIFGNLIVMTPLLRAAGIVKQEDGLCDHRILNLEERTPDRDRRIYHVGPYIDGTKYSIVREPTDPRYLRLVETEKADASMLIGDTRQGYEGKGYIDTTASYICDICAAPLTHVSVVVARRLNITCCSACAAAALISCVDNGLHKVATYKENINECVTYNIKYPTEIIETRFIDQDAFNSARLQPYRNTDMFVRESDCKYLAYRGEYVLATDCIYISYMEEYYLRKDVIYLNKWPIPIRQLTKEYTFKYNTISGYKVDYVAAHMHEFYFTYTINITADSVCFAVSKAYKKQAKNTYSANDLLIRALGTISYDKPVLLTLLPDNINLIEISANILAKNPNLTTIFLQR